MYEGEIILTGFPEHLHTEILNLIHSYGERAKTQDPQDRVIEVEELTEGFRVTTTENQLADRLAKKIKDVFKKVDVHFSHSKEPYEVDRVRVAYQEK